MKKALTITALSLIGLIVVTIIVLGFVNVNFSQVSINEAQSVTVYKDGKSNIFYKNDNSKEFNDISKLYNKQSKISVLNGIFTGALSKKAEIKNENTSMTNKLTSGYWIIFKFDKDQTLKLDGKDYYDKTSYDDSAVKFTRIAFQVTNEQGLIPAMGYVYDGTSSTQVKNTVKFYANLENLYSYIANLQIA